MDIFSSSVDLVRVVFLIGAVLALIYKKKMGVTPGGIIVPGLLANVLFESFIAFLITVTNTLLCWLIYRFVISNYALSNRWTSLVTISVSVTLSLASVLLFETYHFMHQETLLLSMVVPGLITIAAKKYRLAPVLFATSLVTAGVGAIGLILYQLIPYGVLTYLSSRLAGYPPLELDYAFIALPISLLAAILIYYRFGIRGGGYLIMPFLALLAVAAPIQAAMVAAGVALSVGVVKLLQRYTLIIGLERFVLSLFCGYFTMSLADFAAIQLHLTAYNPTPLILIIAVAVLTNDLCLQSIRNTLAKGMAPSFVVSLLTRLAI